MSKQIYPFKVFEPSIKERQDFEQILLKSNFQDYKFEFVSDDDNTSQFLKKNYNHLSFKMRNPHELFEEIMKIHKKLAITNNFKEVNTIVSNESSILNCQFNLRNYNKYDWLYFHDNKDRPEIFLGSEIRDIFHRCEIFKFRFEKSPLINPTKKQEFKFIIQIPYLLNSFQQSKLSFAQKNKFLDENIQQQSRYAKLKFQMDDHIKIRLILRWIIVYLLQQQCYIKKLISYRLKNKINRNELNIQDSSQYIINNQIEDSSTQTFKLKYKIIDSLKSKSVDQGKLMNLNIQLGLNQQYSSFIKSEFRFLQFQNLNNKVINFSNDLKLGAMVFFNEQQTNINDQFNKSHSFRGFKSIGRRHEPWDKIAHPNAGNPGYEYMGDCLGQNSYLQNTFKINIYNYPFLQNFRMVPFLYGSVSYIPTSGKNIIKNQIMNDLRASYGVGINLKLRNKNFELLYNIGHLFQQCDQPLKLQFHIWK